MIGPMEQPLELTDEQKANISRENRSRAGKAAARKFKERMERDPEWFASLHARMMEGQRKRRAQISRLLEAAKALDEKP